MKLQQLGDPLPNQTPQSRYASLHLAVDKGMASETTWRELAQVCLQLGYHDEARRALENLAHPSSASIPAAPHSLTPKSEPRNVATPPRPARRPIQTEVAQAFQFLFLDHMPLTVIVVTMTFPLVVGLGGFLTAGTQFILFSAIALLPGLSVLGLVGALARRILIESAEGIDDPPRIPETATLAREAWSFLRDAIVLGGVCLGPAALMRLLGVPVGLNVACLALGTMLLPMAMLARQVTTSWKSLSPNVLFVAITRTAADYLPTAGVIGGIFVPALVAGIITMGSPVYLQISVIGPLSVAPLFIAARLMGRLLRTHQEVLAPLLGIVHEAALENVVPATTTARPASAPRQVAKRAASQSRRPLGSPSHPEAARGARPAASGMAPGVRPAALPPAAAPRQPARPAASSLRTTHGAQDPRAATDPRTRAPGAPQSARAAEPPRAAPSAGAAPQPRPAQHPRPAARPAPGEQTPAAGRRPAAPRAAPAPSPSMSSAFEAVFGKQQQPHGQVIGEAVPDLTKMPGVSIVKGKDRAIAGAAASTPNTGRPVRSAPRPAPPPAGAQRKPPKRPG